MANQTCLKIKGDVNSLIATGNEFDGKKQYGFDSTTTTQYAIKTAKLPYDLTGFSTTNASCNAILWGRISSVTDLKALGAEALVRSWLTTITIFNIHKERISEPAKDGLEDIQKNICKAVNELKPTALTAKEQCIKDNFGDDEDKYNEAKKECKDKKSGGEEVDWSDSRCKCHSTSSPVVVINKVDGCIDPNATNYYCKKYPSKCGADNDTLPEDADGDSLMVPTQCYYKVDETLEYTYILSSLDDLNPENSVNTWSGDIVISGSSSFDSPDDNSWLTKSYEPWKSYWTEKCSEIKNVNIHFSTEKGLYVNQKDELILPDLVKALLKFTSDYGKVTFIKNYKIMIMNGNDNLGILSFYKNKLTLQVRDTDGELNFGVLSYRLKENNGSQVSSSEAPNATSDNFNYYFRKKTKLDNLVVSVDSDKNISVEKLTNETTIGLGTLLERKDKPILGLGSLLNR